jgi:two-component system, OmpR family, phosphate regulon sensor histidine kinase PhoR
MSTGSWITLALVIGLVILAIFYGRLRKQLWQEKTLTARLARNLAAMKHKMAEVKMRRKKLLSAATQALIIVEKDYHVSSANKVAKQLFGPVDRGITFMQWTRQHQLRELVDQTLTGQKMPPVYFTKDDKTLEAHARSIKGHSPDGRKTLVAVALSIHDVTELHRLSRARRDFVTNISHELRSPLASLQLLTETVLNSGLEDRTLGLDLVNKMVPQLDTLNQLAQELLDLSLIESGQTPLRLAVYPLRDIVQTQVDRLLPQAERKNLILNVDIDPDLKVLVDETLMGRVITNLIHNGIKFTDRGGVTISAQSISLPAENPKKDAAETWVMVSIADTGIGIPLDETGRIFERFYKVDRARNRKQAGTGLGLAIAKHIVEAHGGRIWAESSGKAGSTFYLTVPPEE